MHVSLPPPQKATWLEAQLKSLYTKTYCMGSKLDKLEVHVQSQNCGVIKITET